MGSKNPMYSRKLVSLFGVGHGKCTDIQSQMRYSMYIHTLQTAHPKKWAVFSHHCSTSFSDNDYHVTFVTSCNVQENSCKFYELK